MGAYISQSDIEDKFGVDNVAMWSNLANDSNSADTARITTAIASAEQDVNDRFRQSQYVVPLSATGSNGLRPVINWCAALAGVWLYESRVNRTQGGDAAQLVFRAKKAALEDMDLYLANCRTLDCARRFTSSITAPMVV